MRTASSVAWAFTICTLATATQALAQGSVRYVENGHAEQVLDMFWPQGTPTATILFIHGGSLQESGERRTSPLYADVCEALVATGVACASMDYRLAPSFHWPAMAEDVAAAILKVRHLIVEKGAGPQRLFLFGHSSGGHLAAVLATNPTYLATVGLEPADLAGVIAMGCALDRLDAALRAFTADDIRHSFQRFDSDVTTYGTPENWIAANPAHHTGPHVPPTLVIVAERERFFPSILEQGARFVRLLLESEVPADLVVVPGSHRSSIDHFGEAGDATLPAVSRFIAAPEKAGANSK